MWPNLFGAGSMAGLILAAAITAVFGAVVAYAMRNARPLVPDPAADLWRRYEQGDLTSWEVVRMLQLLEEQRPAPERPSPAPPSRKAVEADGAVWALLRRGAVKLDDADRSDYEMRVAR
jgi:hypothetical protein